MECTACGEHVPQLMPYRSGSVQRGDSWAPLILRVCVACRDDFAEKWGGPSKPTVTLTVNQFRSPD